MTDRPYAPWQAPVLDPFDRDRLRDQLEAEDADREFGLVRFERLLDHAPANVQLAHGRRG